MVAAVGWMLQSVAFAQSDGEIRDAVRACQRVPELSARLACYDHAFPPMAESAGSSELTASRAERAALEPEPKPEPEPEPQSPPPVIAQIIEVEMPSLRTTEFRAADGRVFVRSNAATLPRWPEPPFDVEVQTGVFGTTYLRFPESGLRIRVTARD